jgi:GxxExxY protein
LQIILSCSGRKGDENYTADFTTQTSRRNMKRKHDEKEYPLSGLTKKIIRCAYDVYDELGYGLREKVYQKALCKSLEEKGIKYAREKFGRIFFRDTVVGRYYLDFLIENKVALELKVRNDVYEIDINQLLSYIKSENIPIGLLVVFSKTGIKIKRMANTKIADSQRVKKSAG